MRIIFGAFFLCSALLSFSQDQEWRTINSVSEWLEEINNWPDGTYRQNYLRINFNYELDSGFIATSNAELAEVNSTDEKFEINKPVIVRGLDFVGPMHHDYGGRWLTNLHFKEEFSFYHTKNVRLGFKNCTFDKMVQPRLLDSRFWLRFDYCHFKSRINFNNPYEPTALQLNRCKVDSVIFMSAIHSTPSLEILDSEIFGLIVFDKLNKLEIDKSNFEVGIQLTDLDVNRSFIIRKSAFGGLDLSGTNLPAINSYLPFAEVRSKLCVDLLNKDWLIRGDGEMSSKYQGIGEEELMNKEHFDELIANYYKLLAVYKTRGDMDSYNACYTEMRDKVTARSSLLYKEDPSFNRYFDYQINRFTRAFSDYGTRPAKAIVIFFQVVLAFSIFYFFFPSSWNTTNSRKLMGRLSYLGSYFKSKEGLSDLFEKETKDQYQDYNEFREFMSSSEKELPVYFQWLSKPLYYASVSRFNLSKNVLAKTDILNGKWAELPKSRKAFTSSLIGLYLLLYFIYVFVIRCLNAVTLSLNAFSTLGFGEIPTRGIARYVTIIQGFVGWFLLSIFLVSLIGQILN